MKDEEFIYQLKAQEEKIDVLVELIKEVLAVRKEDREYREAHSEEHRYLRSLIAQKEANAKFIRGVAEKVVSGGVWALAVGIVVSIVFTIKAHLLGTVP